MISERMEMCMCKIRMCKTTTVYIFLSFFSHDACVRACVRRKWENEGGHPAPERE